MESLIATEKIIVAVIGLISGGVGSLCAPWVNWGIDKRRLRRTARYKLISSAREYVGSKQYGVRQYIKKDHYHQLRNEFSKSTKLQFDEALEKTEHGENVADYREDTRQLLLKEISRIEKRWYLI
ncbi:hypothetical protein BIZ37_09330 [Photobacterium sp. BZF1]|uniref:hypothetical protein n=1 Tax=Photobacterium sp. BZF1 TaxID=1904457 RepID=UPI0016536509|nr:hypothetical protein [Photobacterium sp. BZF1]MBC7002756.1 hypothetical protein [Photobacterium sp. BZF1]